MILEKTAQKIRKKLRRFPVIQSIFNFLYRFFFTPNSVRKLKFGFCPLCGRNTIILIDAFNLRGAGYCLFCSAGARHKLIAELIKRIIVIKFFYKDLDKIKLKNLLEKINLIHYPLKTILELINSKNFWIYEPSSIGAICNVLKNYDKFIYSEYYPYPNLKGGQYIKDIRHEDLQSLSFKDNSFDLIITQDILEHVENPYLAFKEIYRVLKPNGIHLFTVPIDNNKKTFHYFDEKGNLLQNRIIFHKDPLRSEGSKVYTQFGFDIVNILNDYNIPSFFINSETNRKIGIYSKFEAIISIKKKKK